MLLSDTWRYLNNGTWDELSSNGPSGRSGATLVTDHEGSQILLFGGVLSFGEFSAEVWRLNKNWNWTQLEPIGELAPRRGHAAIMVPETQWMWIIGGESDQGGNAVAALSMVNPDKPKWIAGLPDGPGWRWGLAAAYVPGPVADSSGHIVVFGGTKQDESLAQKTWVLDLGEMGWIPVEAGNPPLRRDHRMVHHDGAVYLFGGANLVGTALGDLWRFDVQKLEWTPLDTEGGPPARRLAAWIDREKSILLMGGSDGNKLFQDAWVFKPESQEWTELVAPAYPSHRSGALMEEMADNSVLLYGGYGTDDLGSVTLNDRWRFDPGPPGGWAHLGNMGPKRVGAALAYDPAGDRIFVHGGKEKVFDGTGEAALWTIHKDGSVDKSTKVASPLFGHSAAWDGVGKRLFLVGGMLNAETPGYQLVAVHEDMSTELLSAASPDSKEYFDELLVGARGFFHFENGNQLLMTTDNGLVLSFDLATHQWTELVAAGEIDTEKLGEPFLVPQGPNLLMGMNWIDLNDGSVQKVAVTTQPKSFEYSMGAYLQSSAKAYLFSGGLYPHRNSFWSLDFGCAE
jgi:N-acetylneuraminic acid mutarotase